MFARSALGRADMQERRRLRRRGSRRTQQYTPAPAGRAAVPVLRLRLAFEGENQLLGPDDPALYRLDEPLLSPHIRRYTPVDLADIVLARVGVRRGCWGLFQMPAYHQYLYLA